MVMMTKVVSVTNNNANIMKMLMVGMMVVLFSNSYHEERTVKWKKGKTELSHTITNIVICDGTGEGVDLKYNLQRERKKLGI